MIACGCAALGARLGASPPAQRARSLCATHGSLPQVRAARREILPDVNSLAALATELQSIWHREIPLAAAIDVQVASCTDGELVVRAPLEPNRNLHGTAFAGSLFSVCALTGWGMTWLALRQRSLGGLIVIADSRIQYRKAVSGEILCRCVAERPALDAALASLAATGRAKVPLTCSIDASDKRAVTFEGEYVVHAKQGH